jgi:hypothetical protein
MRERYAKRPRRWSGLIARLLCADWDRSRRYLEDEEAGDLAFGVRFLGTPHVVARKLLHVFRIVRGSDHGRWCLVQVKAGIQGAYVEFLIAGPSLILSLRCDHCPHLYYCLWFSRSKVVSF